MLSSVSILPSLYPCHFSSWIFCSISCISRSCSGLPWIAFSAYSMGIRISS
nr:MAG TPA: hypothetical protein [Caudoviricetes sp.]